MGEEETWRRFCWREEGLGLWKMEEGMARDWHPVLGSDSNADPVTCYLHKAL